MKNYDVTITRTQTSEIVLHIEDTSTEGAETVAESMYLDNTLDFPVTTTLIDIDVVPL